MPIEFNQVGYTYIDPKSRKRKARRLERGERAEERGKWGADPDAIWALRDVSFTVQDGEFLGICGHTGSGKSTLIQHVNGLIHPSEGRVLFDGADLAEKGVAARVRLSCGMVFQYPEHQLFAETVYEDVAFGPRNMGLSAQEVDERVREALEAVGLSADELAEKSPFELSGGQQRRVAFAGVLAMRPKVLVLDEPVAGLDPKARREFLALIKGLHETGLTILMISHSMEDLARFCDRVLVLSEGRKLMLGTPEEVFSDAALLKSVGLAQPAPQAMAQRLRARGFDLPRSLYGIDELADDLAAQLALGGQGAGGHDACEVRA